MKRRLTAATVAAATALSLAVAPTASAYEFADPGFHKDSSSEVDDTELAGYVLRMVTREVLSKGAGISGPAMASSEAGLFNFGNETTKADLGAMRMSSFRNDANNGYKLGTTHDILVGTGIALTLLAGIGGFALSQGLIKF